MTISVTVAYGDGIGPEIMEAVLLILREAQANLSVETVEIGHRAYAKEWNTGIAPSAWESIHRTKILLKAPTSTPQGTGHKSLNVTLRKRLGLYANVRPSIAYHPLVDTKYPKLDVVIVRENEEDLYTGVEHRLTGDTYQCVKVITKAASERICRYAFDYAVQHNRKKVTCLIKDNIMKMTDGVFHQAFDEVAGQYPTIKADHFIVDIGMARIATEPEKFDVIVTLNLYGDIISDIVSQISGSVGMSGSANIGTEYAMFEAVHGSAPDIAGKGVANPSGLLNAAVQMLVHLEQFAVAQSIYNAWLVTLEQGIHTADIYSKSKSKICVSTHDFAVAVSENLGKFPQSFKGLQIYSQDRGLIARNTVYVPDYHTKRLVGGDISIGWSPVGSVGALVNSIRQAHQGLELVLIHSKGLVLWPDKNVADSVYVGDQICCRFFLKEQDSKITNYDINALLIKLDELGVDVVKMEKLYMYDNKAGFFVEN